MKFSHGAKVALLLKGFNWGLNNITDQQLIRMHDTSIYKEKDASTPDEMMFWKGVRLFCYERMEDLKKHPHSLTYSKIPEAFIY